MLILILVISLLLTIIFFGLASYFNKKSYYNMKNKFTKWLYVFSEEDNNIIIGIITGVIFLASFILTIVLGVEYSSIKIIDDKIELYQQENLEIEEEISLIVENYEEYESSTYSELKDDISPEVVLNFFPELKANELTQHQIELYVANNEEIKHLKEEKLHLQLLGWWLFFK